MKASKRYLAMRRKRETRGKSLFDELRAETDCKAMFFSPSKIK
jgi:hypothetical protein